MSAEGEAKKGEVAGVAKGATVEFQPAYVVVGEIENMGAGGVVDGSGGVIAAAGTTGNKSGDCCC